MQSPSPSSALALGILLAATASPDARAQAPGPTEPTVQSLSPVFVTASPLGSRLFDMADPVNLLQGRELLLQQQPTLGETLEKQVGITSTQFGPNASRPIIRGLGGFDIRLLNNGLGVIDASAASPDHAVAVSPFAVERIEVVRGPATVMYGGSAIGGVVNTIDSRIALQPGEGPFSGSASYRYNSVNELSAGGARLDGGNERFALHADAYATRNRDLKIPGDAWTPEVQAARGEPGPNGSLPNSQGDSQSYGLGGTLFGDHGSYAGVSYGRFTTNYGTVAEQDVTIDLQQEAWNFAGELRDTVPGLSALRVKFGHNDYEHTEYEGSEPGTVFESKGWNLRVEALHRKIGPFEGAIGVEAADVEFSARGDEAFVPSTKTQNLAAFIYEEMRAGAWRFSGGARIERASVDADPFEAAGLPADSVSFTPWGAALGTYYTLSDTWGVGASLQYTQRAPSSQELFADGPHIATDQFEVGDRALGKVTATAIDLALKHRSDGFTSSIGAFYTQFSNYIGLFPTGIWRNPEDRSVTPGPEPIIDPDTGEEITPMQQFDYRAVRARFYGFEAQVEFPLWRQDAHRVSMKLQADYVHATDRDSGEALPFIPPLRIGGSLIYAQGGLTATLGALYAAEQDRVPEFQTSTPGYTDLFVNLTYRLPVQAVAELELFLQGTNLLDDTIRYSTSALKDIAPAGGRAWIAGVRGAF